MIAVLVVVVMLCGLSLAFLLGFVLAREHVGEPVDLTGTVQAAAALHAITAEAITAMTQAAASRLDADHRA